MTSSPDSFPSDLETKQPPSTKESRDESPIFKEFNEKLDTLPTLEEKVSHGLLFMRNSISQEGSPRFKEFWDARRVILPFFKGNINSTIRSKLWNEYVELTVEARRLKEILEEQSSFAMEQIDLAIKALENDVTNFGSLLESAAPINLSESASAIKQKEELYIRTQRELNLLNTLASRLNGLRKEIIKTDMRIRFKTKFFKRLSDLGDHIFPKRKELIEKVSNDFESDVDRFVEKHFKGEEVVGAPFYVLREEIKNLQSIAKIFTLSSGVFTRTRLKLSECWDKVKVLEKEHKQGLAEKKQASSEQRQALQVKIDSVKEKASQLNLKDLDVELDSIADEMKTLSLHRDDVREVRDQLNAIRAPHVAELEKKSRELEEAEKEKLRQKREKIDDLKGQISRLAREGEKLDLDSLTSSFDKIQKEIKDLEISKMERQQIERSLRPIRDLVADKKENSLLNLSDDDKKTLENLRLVLKQKKERRQEIKEQVETYRKALGGSNLDFEKAIQYQDLLEQEKERLEKANAAIEEIELKIASL